MGRAIDRDDGAERDEIAALQRGDIDGLDFLVRRYQIPAIRVAFGITSDRAAAEDVVAARSPLRVLIPVRRAAVAWAIGIPTPA